MKKPLIAIAGNILFMEGGDMPGLPRDYVNRDYSVSVKNSGGIPFIIPTQSGIDDIERCISFSDGLILSGGYDISPDLYGESPDEKLGFTLKDVDLFYKDAIDVAIRMHKPILGICKGMQALNVFLGGTLYQDIPDHVQKTPRNEAYHEVKINQNSFLFHVLGCRAEVNSFHHQAVKDIAPCLNAVAVSSDGIIEAVENPELSIIGVQWHPEMMAAAGNAVMLGFFRRFIELCL